MSYDTHIRSAWISELGYTPGSAKANWHRLGLQKLVTGGQSGVDRAVLDVALDLRLPCGGWCPRGRWAEDGKIDARYPLRETPLVRVPQRTLWNMRDSEGTLILARHRPRGGSAVRSHSIVARRPRLIANPKGERAVRRVIRFIRTNGITVLNIGGPRESEDPRIYHAARAFLLALFSPCWSHSITKTQHRSGAISL